MEEKKRKEERNIIAETKLNIENKKKKKN